MVFSPSHKSPGKLKTDAVTLLSHLTPPGPLRAALGWNRAAKPNLHCSPPARALPHFSGSQASSTDCLERPMKPEEQLMAGSHGEDVQ